MYISAKEAAEILDVSVTTIYAYVSRGLIRSQAIKDKKTKLYHRQDIMALKRRKEHRRDPDKSIKKTLSWGAPVLESSITYIDTDLYYRGQNVADLVHLKVEQVAELIWGYSLRKDIDVEVPKMTKSLAQVSTFDRLQILLPLIACNDIKAYDLRPDSVVNVAQKILYNMVSITTQTKVDKDIASTLQRHWHPQDVQATKLLDAALILCADHELNVSSFTARCVASAGSTPYAVVCAGLSALQGYKHGGQGELTFSFLETINTQEDAQRKVVEYVRNNLRVPGFGQPLYPKGDPRAKILLGMLQNSDHPIIQRANYATQQVDEILGLPPNIDLALACLAGVLNIAPSDIIVVLALGRTIGWLGHALEQYKEDKIIRPRAQYTGIMPNAL